MSDGNDVGEDRPLDEELGDHWPPVPGPAAAAEAEVVTGTHGVAGQGALRPPTTTRSFGNRPLLMMRSPAVDQRHRSRTGRCSTTFLSLTMSR